MLLFTPDAITGCDPNNPMKLSAYYRYIGDLDISGFKDEQFGCGWDHTKTAQIQLVFVNQGPKVATIDSIPPQKPEPPKPKWVWVPKQETYSVKGVSGNGHDWSAPFEACSDENKVKDPDWVIPDDDNSVSYYMTGDRVCGAHATCNLSSRTTKKVCYIFTLQGHDDAKPGMRESTLNVVVNWKHRVPVESLEKAPAK